VGETPENGERKMNGLQPEKKLYNAKFSGPRGDLNPMGLKVPGTVSVQVWPITALKWTIKNPDTNGALCGKLTFDNPDKAKAYCSEIFTKQETEWEVSDLL
jgi:hypothetical protein